MSKYVYEELLQRKKYLKDENYCPNVGLFKYGKSKSVDRILHGSDVYRYNIYKYRDDDDRIRNLGGGDPIAFKPYKYVVEDINNYLKNCSLNEYPHTSGNDSVKNKLIDYLNSININNVDEDNLIITASTTHAYSLLLKSIIREHDVVIIPTPTYGLFVYEPEKLGGKVEFIELREENGWKIDLDELENKISSINKELMSEYNYLSYVPRVVSIYHQNPNNPLGTSYSVKDKKYLYNLAKLCDKYRVLIIDDLVYRDLVYDEKNISLPLATFSEFKDNVVSLFGISKSYSLASLRSGFMVGNKYIIQDMRDNIFIQMDSISILSQISLASVFNNDIDRVKYRNKFLKEIKIKYLENLDIVKFFIEGTSNVSKKVLNRIKKKLSNEEFEYYKDGIKDISIYNNLIPETGFFILIDFTKIRGKKINKKIINNDVDLIIELFKKEKIKFLPGSSFGWNNDEQIIGRITFSKEWDTLFEDMKVLSDILKKIR